MLHEFLKFIEDNRLIKKNDRVLLAVSGGIDSMVMTDLFIKSGINIGIAHCNFTLRAGESDKDEKYVREFATDHNIPYYSQRFDTRAISCEKKISVQMAARNLRYTWFEEIRNKNGYDSIAVAHNLSDNVETFLINLARGTGIKGLSGIKKKSGRVIRPILFASRLTIEEYSTNWKINYREDSSNIETKYTRNKIRHLILPLMKEINPSIEAALNETAERLSSVNDIFYGYISSLRKTIFKNNSGIFLVNISLLRPFLNNNTVLFELFRPFGTGSGTLTDLHNIIKGKTGIQLITDTHRIIKNRNELIITARSDQKKEISVINTLTGLKKNQFISSVRKVSMSESLRIPSNPEIACIDYQKISFPLIIRKWQFGDIFYPLGMKHRKKLSDYFIDRKFSILEKENKMVLESAGSIVWIIGERLDNRFRINESTKEALIIKPRVKG